MARQGSAKPSSRVRFPPTPPDQKRSAHVEDAGALDVVEPSGPWRGRHEAAFLEHDLAQDPLEDPAALARTTGGGNRVEVRELPLCSSRRSDRSTLALPLSASDWSRHERHMARRPRLRAAEEASDRRRRQALRSVATSAPRAGSVEALWTAQIDLDRVPAVRAAVDAVSLARADVHDDRDPRARGAPRHGRHWRAGALPDRTTPHARNAGWHVRLCGRPSRAVRGRHNSAVNARDPRGARDEATQVLSSFATASSDRLTGLRAGRTARGNRGHGPRVRSAHPRLLDRVVGVRDVRDDNNRVQRLTFLLWLFAFLVCLSVLSFIAFGYLGHALDAFPKLG